MTIERYDEAQQGAWNAFIASSRNAPFLYRRDYMDYHRDRFEDHSLVVRSPDGDITAVMPAHRRGSILNSHGGLTYGGFAVGPDMKTAKMLAAFAAAIEYLQKNGFSELLYKTVPYIYHTAPAEEDRYALYLCGAEWHLSSPTTVVPSNHRLPYQNRRMRGVRKARQHGLTTHETVDFESFWTILECNLADNHQAAPVHSAAEISLLKQRCPDNIRLFACYEGDLMLAGVVVYESARVAHAQYIASTSRGRQIGAMDLLVHSLLTELLAHKAYFDFGSSSEGTGINAGLIEQKEGFGARAVTQDWYRVDVTRVSPSDLLAALR